MATTKINNKEIEYGSIIRYRYRTESSSTPSVASIRKTLKNKEPLIRIDRITGKKESYNYNLDKWE